MPGTRAHLSHSPSVCVTSPTRNNLKGLEDKSQERQEPGPSPEAGFEEAGEAEEALESRFLVSSAHKTVR